MRKETEFDEQSLTLVTRRQEQLLPLTWSLLRIVETGFYEQLLTLVTRLQDQVLLPLIWS